MDLEIAHCADDADLLISEAQYTEKEYAEKKGWEHSTYPFHDDAFLDGILEFCQKTIADRNYTFSCFLAQEGTSIEL